MRWLDWLHPRRGKVGTEDSLDLDGIVAEGLSDAVSAQRAITQLKRARKALVGRQRAIESQHQRQFQRRVRMLARGHSASVELEAYELSQVMRDAGAASQAGTLRAGQIAAIDVRIHAIDHAIAQLNTYRRSQENPDGPAKTP
jgi:hypothetical protein